MEEVLHTPTSVHPNGHGDASVINAAQLLSERYGIGVVQPQAPILHLARHSQEPPVAKLLEQLYTHTHP